MPTLRNLVALAVTAATMTLAPSAHAAFPDRPIKMIVPFPAGGSADLIARVLSDLLGKKLGVSVVVQNRPGASGTLGMTLLTRAPADGYTLASSVSEPLTINPHTSKVSTIDVDKSVEPLALVARTNFVLLTSKAFAADDLQGVLKLAKQKPDAVSIGSYGIAEMFISELEYETGTKFLRVPYQGAAPAIAAVMGSQVDVTIVATSTAHAAAGRVKMIAVGGNVQLEKLPGVKTFAQQGLPKYKISNWSAVVAPQGLPPQVHAVLTPAIEAVVRSDEFKARMSAVDIEAEYGGPEELKALMRDDSARWRKVVKEMNIPLN